MDLDPFEVSQTIYKIQEALPENRRELAYLGETSEARLGAFGYISCHSLAGASWLAAELSCNK